MVLYRKLNTGDFAQNGTCVNYGEAGCPKEIAGQSICIDGDMGEVLSQLIGFTN